MKKLKLIGLAICVLFLSFFISFFGLQIYKYASAEDKFAGSISYDLIIKNARIIDGTGNSIFRGEIGIKNDIIFSIKDKIQGDGKVVFDAAGYTVAPAKVEWPEDLDWIARDLTTVAQRFPLQRLVIKGVTGTPDWEGRSVQAILAEGDSTLQDIILKGNVKVLVMPVMPELSNISQNAFFNITGWRGEVLDKKLGKIKEGYPAQLVVFNHREIKENKLLNYLQQEKLPPIDFYINGKSVQSTKTNS